MPETPSIQQTRRAFSGNIFQCLAIAICVLLSLAMIVNTQLGGEAMWFWYATIFHQGARLYSQLHTALQPFFILETDAWLQLVGTKIMATQTLSLLHILAMCAALFLLLRESVWPDWQKACVLLGAFAFTVSGHSYRFDDYHVLAEAFIFFGLLLLLMTARASSLRRQLELVAVLGVLCGCTITTRLTDGAALLTAAAICLLFLLRQKKLASLGLLFLCAALTVLLVVRLTGDTFSSYIFSSIIRAAGSKGGTGSIFAAPFLMLRNTPHLFWILSKRVFLAYLVVLAIGPLVYRYWKAGIRYIFALELAVAVLMYFVVPHPQAAEFLRGSMISMCVLTLTMLMYFLPLVVLVRLVRARMEHREWDAREVLVLLPLAEWASYSAGAAAEPLTNYYAPVAMLLLLYPVLQPFRRQAAWANASFAAFMLLLAFSSISGKIIVPYSWQNYVYGPMFVDRQWFHHPVYGEMYIDSDLLRFSESVCADIGSVPGRNQPELLSLPYPFPNYFCATPPWHNYVQTFFDTSTRATIEHLIGELNTAPPQYIVYQRQLNIMTGAERLYNHNQPLAQRALDAMIMQKIASGQWTLVDKSDYLSTSRVVTEAAPPGGVAWFIIRTHP